MYAMDADVVPVRRTTSPPSYTRNDATAGPPAGCRHDSEIPVLPAVPVRSAGAGGAGLGAAWDGAPAAPVSPAATTATTVTTRNLRIEDLSCRNVGQE